MKNLARLLSVSACLALSGCGDSGPALTVENIRVIAPAPGRSASVAYMSIRNYSDDEIIISHFSSPQFARVEMHETTISSDGIAQMQPLNQLAIAAESTVEFSAGGKHVMLLEPFGAILPGKDVSLRLHYGSDEVLLIDTPLTTRAAAPGQ